MFTITIHHLDGPSGLQRHVGYVHVDGEDVQIHDPEGHLDLERPPPPSTTSAAASAGAPPTPRTRSCGPTTCLPCSAGPTCSPSVMTRRRTGSSGFWKRPQAPAASSPGDAELIARLIAGGSAAKEAAAEPA